jgi:hypothetical protein
MSIGIVPDGCSVAVGRSVVCSVTHKRNPGSVIARVERSFARRRRKRRWRQRETRVEFDIVF